MPVQHISEVLREIYNERAREDLDSIAYNGFDNVIDSGGWDEIAFLKQIGALNDYDVNKSQYEYLSDTLWRN